MSGEEVEETEMSGFDCEQQTFLCANVSFGQLIQVCKKNNTNLIMHFGYCEGNIRDFLSVLPVETLILQHLIDWKSEVHIV